MSKFPKKINGSSNKADLKPPRGSEVFVGKIPRNLNEEDLRPLFESIGTVHEMRLMFNRNGENRGFAFVTFANPAVASKAIKTLNNYEIRPRQHIGVIRSLDNCRLFLGGIPKDKTENDVLQEMSRVTTGIVRIIMYSSVADKSKNRGFAFVEYESHKAAAIARRHCVSGSFQLWGKAVAVDWAEPEPVVDEEILSKVQILYVRNLLVSTKEEDLAELFNGVSEKGVEKVKIIDDFAFVHFTTRNQAEKALASLQNYELNGVRMQITWAKPMLRKNGQTISKLSDKQVVVDNGSHFSPTAITNLDVTCAPPINYGYSVPPQGLPYLPFTALSYPPYQNLPINPLTHEAMLSAHGMHGSFIGPKAIPLTFQEEKQPSWPNQMILNNVSQGLSLTNELCHFYGYPSAPLPHPFHQLHNHNLRVTEILNASLSGISTSDSNCAQIQQLS